MKRYLLVLPVMAVVTALMLVAVTPVFGSIDPIVESECAAQDSQSDNSGSSKTAGDNQHPPGQTPGDGIGDGGNLKGVQKSIGNSGGQSTSGEGANHCTNPGND